MKSVGIDVGGTKIAGALVSEDGVVLSSLSRPSHPNDAKRMVEAIAELVRELAGGETELTVGVAVAAFLNRERTDIHFSPNISWPNFPIKAELEQALSAPVVVENDANAAGWAEYRFGAGIDARSLMMLTLGTGVGGAVIEDGKLLIGANGSGGELGHLVVEPGGRLCGCGNLGCLEQYASGVVVMRQIHERTGDSSLDSEAALRLFEAHDERVTAVFFEVADVIARAMTSLVAIVDPEVIVIGGGVAKAGEPLKKQIEQRFDHHYPAHTLRPTARVELARLGNLAGSVGAADLARHATRSRL